MLPLSSQGPSKARFACKLACSSGTPGRPCPAGQPELTAKGCGRTSCKRRRNLQSAGSAAGVKGRKGQEARTGAKRQTVSAGSRTRHLSSQSYIRSGLAWVYTPVQDCGNSYCYVALCLLQVWLCSVEPHGLRLASRGRGLARWHSVVMCRMQLEAALLGAAVDSTDDNNPSGCVLRRCLEPAGCFWPTRGGEPSPKPTRVDAPGTCSGKQPGTNLVSAGLGLPGGKVLVYSLLSGHIDQRVGLLPPLRGSSDGRLSECDSG